ncbi:MULTISPECIES: HupE/UreJ family protein [Bradyrhizobium]|uniref:HupE/UreJ family protein n=1 Tax=Bradyrhizobium TaxID=374 RepID=UPI00155F1D41|nr:MULTISPECIES: HupE/UreJ family protein [Bradyrhizobium]MDD1519138.1 hydrogenase/urease accessory protein [Bradyrhizobium sp. WBAH30]MDD1543382.1 hydrogenase/urease accessory protein [Bradyrhizobium sp. WBAH41]MDD1557512.1 hydrogenase/urease accessory protein [Bradyrhizobium sp. WBAH23]MDD1564924.1 hydrogenase/urease accessory protein [Bradyrhizobium sp. WBAH33]MDD1590332.1 hydrogenase/urease accessory protein [Bradyrhizobium sp. WBAH42]
MRRPLLAWLAVLLGLALPAEAHEVNLVTARVALSPDRTVSAELGLKGSDVDRLIGTKIYDARRDAVDPAAVEAAKPAILAYMGTHLAVTGGARACSAGNAAILADGDGIVYRNSFACANVTGDIVYRSTVLTEKDRAARQVVLIAQGRSETQALLDAHNTTVTLSTAPPSLSSTMQRYLITGVEHIFLGYDHVAFLVAIVLWARRLLPVVKIVTAFTIAHSLTLSLAALNVLVIPSRIVEPAIAASIVFVAVENFFSRDIDRRWRVAFLFGLIHGFGFAGALREIGLPPDAIVSALAAFNVGVEIGQIAIVALLLPVLGVLDRLTAVGREQPARAAGLVYAMSGGIGLLGGYWLLRRVFEA